MPAALQPAIEQVKPPPMPHRDLDWLAPSAAITCALGIFAASFMWISGFSAAPDPVFSLGGWLAWTLISGCAAIILYTFKLMVRSVPNPIAHIRQKAANWRRYLVVFTAMMLAGLDLYFFMLVKPELDLLFPFWADPHLADIDHALLGTDAWRLFSAWDIDLMAWIYSPGWFLSMLVVLFWLLLQPPSETKSTAILTYFVLWSVFGPLGQATMSSAGPIFYARIGLGERFSEMSIPTVTRMLADYLWFHYEQRSLAPGAGISAMPSMHIASMAWMVLALLAYRSWWAVPAILLTTYIYIGSVALGWHYATDGLVGAAGAVLCLHLVKRYFQSVTGSSGAGRKNQMSV